MSNYLIYYLFPIFMLILSLSLWLLFPRMINAYNFSFGVLFFICCSGMWVYGGMLSCWSSDSSYVLFSGLRAIAQTISYEASMSLIVLCDVILMISFDVLDFNIYQQYCWFVF